MADVLTYVLHYEGVLNKNSLGAVSEGAARAADIGGECHAVVVGGDDLTDELCQSVGAYGATKVFRGRGPEGLAQPIVDVMAKVIDDHGHAYALFGGGLLGFEIGAGLAARKQAGVTMEVTAVKAEDGKPINALGGGNVFNHGAVGYSDGNGAFHVAVVAGDDVSTPGTKHKTVFIY